MKECWVTEPLHFEMRETEIPEPKDNEVQIKMMAAGVCGSDIHIYKGENPNSRYPLIPGHENVGLSGVPVQQDCECGQQAHVQCGMVGVAQLLQGG